MQNELLNYKIYKNSPNKDWVVFIHGIGGNSGTFYLQLKAFQPHFNLLLPDLRGHGLSNNLQQSKDDLYSLQLIANDVFKLLKHLDIKKAHFIGTSFGAILIRIIDELQPNLIHSIVMSGAVLRIKSSIYIIFKSGKFLAGIINNHFLYKIMAHFIMPRKNHSKARKIFIKQALSIDESEYKKWLVILENVKKKLDNIFKQPFNSPTLLVMGDQDHAFLNDSKKFCSINPTQLEILKNCGHVSNIEKHDHFNNSAIKFIKSNGN